VKSREDIAHDYLCAMLGDPNWRPPSVASGVAGAFEWADAFRAACPPEPAASQGPLFSAAEAASGTLAPATVARLFAEPAAEPQGAAPTGGVPEPVEDDPCPNVWIPGAPTKHYAEEWFIALLGNGDRAVLRALPEEHTYDFTTADGTYSKRDLVVKWMQFPDSEYKPAAPTEQARDAEADELMEQLLKQAAWLKRAAEGADTILMAGDEAQMLATLIARLAEATR